MISLAEVLFIVLCTAVMFLVLGVAAWILLNRSKFQQSRDRNARLDALERDYAAGDLDDAEYERRRSEILDDRMQ